MVEKDGEVSKKNKRREWSKSNKNFTRVGKMREPVKIQVCGDLDGRINFDELIEPALVVFSDSVHVSDFNFLNNAKNNMIDNFWSIKWLFQEIEILKDRNNQANSKSTDKNQEAGKGTKQGSFQDNDFGQDPRNF